MGGAGSSKADSRASARLALRYPATLTLLDETRHTGWTVDLSYGGICVQTETRLRLTQYCAVRFDAMLDGAALPVLALGQVAYSEPEPQGGFRNGIGFIKLDPASTQAIDRLLKNPPPCSAAGA